MMASRRDTSESAETIPVKCSSLRKNGLVMLQGRPCKIVEMTTARPGKHGHAKSHIIGLDIFTGTKHEANCPSTHNIDVPVVTKKEYQVVSVNKENFFSLMDNKGSVSSHISYDTTVCAKPIDDIKKWLEECENDDELVVSVQTVGALGDEKIIDARKKSFRTL